jgi:hypothetical protein
MRLAILNGLVGSAIICLLAPTAASAQYLKLPCTTCKKSHPLLDKICPQKICAPTVCPVGCFGYIPTRWAPWAAVCPDSVMCEHPQQTTAPSVGIPTLSQPTPIDSKKPSTEPGNTPKTINPPDNQPNSDTNTMLQPITPNTGSQSYQQFRACDLRHQPEDANGNGIIQNSCARIKIELCYYRCRSWVHNHLAASGSNLSGAGWRNCV